MPAADKSINAFLESAKSLFGSHAFSFDDNLCDECDNEQTKAFFSTLGGRKWLEIVGKGYFDKVARQNDFDLGDITKLLSRNALRYFLPGFLLHFLAAGTYQDSIVGPTFFYNFVARLQADNEHVVKLGGPRIYFDLDERQTKFCTLAMEQFLRLNGDQYVDAVGKGYEYEFVAKLSITRALDTYWRNA
jgi:hypothetical protein